MSEKRRINFVWAVPNKRIRKWFPTSPCIVMITEGEKKVYSMASGHFFYKHEFTYEESVNVIAPPTCLVDIANKQINNING